MTTLTIRTSDDTKADLKKIAKEMGLTVSGLLNAMIMNLRKTRKLEVSAQPDWNSPDWTPSDRYYEEMQTDPDFKETVFISEKPGDTRKFLESLMNEK